MATPFRWGIIGPGRIAHAFAQAIDVVDDAVVHAVASRDRARGQEFADTYQIATVYDSYAELVADAAIDAVYIATPHRFHAEQALLCLNASKPVLCEKPLTVNARETAALIEAARANNVFLMEALWTRFLPIYADIRRWLDAGSIGAITLLTSTFGFAMPRNLDDRLWNHELAGGALLDLGVYNLAISQWVQRAEPTSFAVQATLGATNVDEQTAVNLHYADGSISQWTCTMLSQVVNDFHIYGSDGHIRIHPSFNGGTQATLVTKDHQVTATQPWRASGFEYQIEEAMRCIRAGLIESPTMSHADSLATMTLMDRIRAEIGLQYSFERD